MAVTAEADPLATRCPFPGHGPLTTRDVAVLIPAHNEALVLEESLRSIMPWCPGTTCTWCPTDPLTPRSRSPDGPARG